MCALGYLAGRLWQAVVQIDLLTLQIQEIKKGDSNASKEKNNR